jgi:EAL domain-containing protein (putative c-di-GMP-specific phosphodiesterase class I)
MESGYYLESFSRSMDFPQQIAFTEQAITVGRSADSDVIIHNAALSRRHARLEWIDNSPAITDLGSTNGSFVNRQRITSTTALDLGDVVHFAGVEYCLKQKNTATVDDANDHTRINYHTLPSNFPIRAKEFTELLNSGLVTSYQQAIMDRSGELYGFELLGRGRHPALNENPYELFLIAAQMGKEIELSELFRQHSFALASRVGTPKPVFFNCHPLECREPDKLLSGIRQLRQQYPELKLVFEVHESAITDLNIMKRIRSGLRDLDIGLAYDDFGAGQARILELAEAPPDILKFDISLVRGVGKRSSTHFKLLSSLNTMVQDMGVATLAEGVEDSEVAEACLAIGIDYFQGFYFGRPAEISV